LTNTAAGAQHARIMRARTALLLLALTFSSAAHASNVAPLAFGMTPEEAAVALKAPLQYLAGRPDSEVFAAERDAGVPGFYPVHEWIYLQFRRGKLSGWKKDWRLLRGWLF
jgi:hypothetical protein